MKKIYYVEDDRDIAGAVKEYFDARGFLITIFSRIFQAQAALEAGLPDLVLLDWNMPDGGGDRLCRFIRDRWSALPVIFLTVKGETSQVVQGFSYGADDYVVKPFELEVLHSRVCALLRRSLPSPEAFLTCGGITLNRERMAVYVGEEEISLSQAEYDLLLLLMENKGKTLTRDRLLEQVWDRNGVFVNDNTLTVTIKRLREKLGGFSGIKTIRSFGYRMEDGL